MASSLTMVEEPAPSKEVTIDEDRLKFFNSKLRICDYAKISSSDYQKLSFEDKSSILKSYYVDMPAKYSLGTGSSGFKKANLVLMTKATTDNDKNISTKIVAATFENGVWKSFGYFDARKSDCSIVKIVETSNTPQDISSYTLKENKVKMVRPRYDSETGEFKGLYETVGFLVVRGSPEKLFFNYGFDKEKSKILYSHYRRKILNSFSGTIFNRHRTMIESGEVESC